VPVGICRKAADQTDIESFELKDRSRDQVVTDVLAGSESLFAR
jgi:hypothetical protein